MRNDAIDILVDLTGHIGSNRLPMFARRPAPIQVTYIGYQNTTGMSAMDYRLTDAHADPPGETDRYYTEKLVRLPRSFFCYRPPDDAPPVTPLPALERGGVTFGSFNKYVKVTPPTIAAWLQILERLPNARLLVLAKRGGSAESRLCTARPPRASIRVASNSSISSGTATSCAWWPRRTSRSIHSRSTVTPRPANRCGWECRW